MTLAEQDRGGAVKERDSSRVMVRGVAAFNRTVRLDRGTKCTAAVGTLFMYTSTLRTFYADW